MKKDTKYKLIIWNFTKPKSLYRDGMKPMWKSKKKCKYQGIDNEEEGWEFIPDENLHGEIHYGRSHLKRMCDTKGVFDKLFEEDKKDKEKEKEPKQYVKRFKDNSYYYSLSFTLSFDYNKDTVFICYSRPYKFTKIINDVIFNEGYLM